MLPTYSHEELKSAELISLSLPLAHSLPLSIYLFSSLFLFHIILTYKKSTPSPSTDCLRARYADRMEHNERKMPHWMQARPTST